MKPEIICFALLAIALITYSCTKEGNQPAAPIQRRPDTTVQTIPPIPAEAILSSDWLSLKPWTRQMLATQNLFTSTISISELKQSFINDGAVLVFCHDKRTTDFVSIPDNADMNIQNFVEYNNDFLSTQRQAGSITIMVATSHNMAYQEMLTYAFEFRYFLIPKSRLKQGLDYKDYNAVCNFYEIKK